MTARTTHPLKVAALFALLVAVLMLFLSRPAAQISGVTVQSILENATAVAGLAGNPAFEVAGEPVDGDALFRFYDLRNSRLAWSGNARALADAAVATRALSNAQEHELDTGLYHLGALKDVDVTSNEGAATYDLLLTDAILKYARQSRKGQWGTVDQGVEPRAEAFGAVSAVNSALEEGTLAAFLAGFAPPRVGAKPKRRSASH